MSQVNRRFVYVIKDSAGVIRYVGSTRNPKARRAAIWNSRNALGIWLRNESFAKRVATMEIVFEADRDGALQKEKELIAEYLRQGFDLFNIYTWYHHIKLSNFDNSEIAPVARKPKANCGQRDTKKYWKKLAGKMKSSGKFQKLLGN